MILLKVFELADVRVPTQSEPELSFYNPIRNAIEVYDTDERPPIELIGQDGLSPLINTGHMKVYSDVIRNFLQNDERQPFVLCGPSGVGKT